jgi:hypothetical protein
VTARTVAGELVEEMVDEAESLRMPLDNIRLCLVSLNFAHVPVVDAGHLAIVPGNRDRIPTCIGDNSAICGIASPIDTSVLL